MVKALKIAAFLTLAARLCLGAIDTVNPQDAIIGPFGGLNTRDNAAIIGASQAQDLLNVDITPGGKSVKKRQGFALDTTFSISTSAIHGTYKFFDANGNEVRLVGQDTGLFSSVAGATFVRVASGTLSATWQCTDWLGQAYCVTSSRDTPVRTDGTVAGTSFQSAIPAGSCIASTADRLLVANTATNPSRLYYSGSTNFTDFTLGTLVTSSSFEDITAPGSQITHLAYRYGYWMWWKDQSVGYLSGTDQTNLLNFVISDIIGTYDNTDIFWQGTDYFRGNDSHIYQYDGATLIPMTRDITPTVTSTNRRKSSSWTQTSQTDFQAGTNVPTVALSETISPGSVVVASSTQLEFTGSQWNLGTNSNMTIGTSSITLAVNNSGNVTNNDFESAFAGNWTASGNASFLFSQKASQGTGTCTISPQSSSNLASNAVGLTGFSFDFTALDLNNNVLQTTTLTNNNDCTMRQSSLTPSAANLGKRVKFRFHDVSTDGPGDEYLTTSDSYIWGGQITFYYASKTGASNTFVAFDLVQNGSSTITTGAFTSQAYNSGYTSATYQINTFNYVANTSSPTIDLQTSTDSIHWSELFAGTGKNAIGNRYFRYTSTMSINSSDSALTYIQSVGVIFESSGSYYSAVNNASALTSWSNLGITDTLNGNSSIAYYSRSSTNSFSVLSTTPAWVSQTKNATVSASTGTYFQLRGDFTVTAATETPTLNDFTFNWFEGNASDKMYGTYYDYALWFSVSLGATSSNNRVLRYDLLNQFWTVYDIPSNGFMLYNNSLYLASPTVGKLYKFGNSVTSDDNVAINSYWKSKDYFGASPFNDEDMRTISWYAAESSGTTLTVSYQVNESTTTSYNINLYSANSNLIRSNRNFPAGTMVNTINFKLADNSTNPLWEVFAGQYSFVPRVWNVQNP